MQNTTDLNLKYLELSTEVKNFIETNRNLFESFSAYTGVQILYSQLHLRPRLMFIGINPGNGFFKVNQKRVEDYSVQEDFEYLEDSYSLANNTKRMFMDIGMLEELECAVKTNWCFVSTPNSSDLKKLITSLYKHNINLYEQSDKWLRSLIEIIQPQIIICEGKEAFDRVTWNALGWRGNDEFGAFGYRQTDSCKHVIGYRRNHSTILNSNQVGEKVKQLILAL